MVSQRNEGQGGVGSARAIAVLNGWWRYAAIGLGWLLLFVAPVVGLLPGPGGIVVAAIGTFVLLRYSRDARRLFVRFKRRYPKMMWPLRKAVDRFRTRVRRRR